MEQPMINITLSDEQVVSLLQQLSKEKKEELLEHLQFEKWLDSPEALKLKEEREKEIEEGRVLTLDEMKEKLRANGKKI